MTYKITKSDEVCFAYADQLSISIEDMLSDFKYFSEDKKYVWKKLEYLLRHRDGTNYDRASIDRYFNYVESLNGRRSNIFDLQYIQYLYNCDEESAIVHRKNYCERRATSLLGFQKRHGKDEGVRRFEKFQATSASSSSDEYYKAKYADSWEEKRREAKTNSPRFPLYWINLGHSPEESKAMSSEFQRKNSGVSQLPLAQRPAACGRAFRPAASSGCKHPGLG